MIAWRKQSTMTSKCFCYPQKIGMEDKIKRWPLKAHEIEFNWFFLKESTTNLGSLKTEWRNKAEDLCVKTINQHINLWQISGIGPCLVFRINFIHHPPKIFQMHIDFNVDEIWCRWTWPGPLLTTSVRNNQAWNMVLKEQKTLRNHFSVETTPAQAETSAHDLEIGVC